MSPSASPRRRIAGTMCKLETCHPLRVTCLKTASDMDCHISVVDHKTTRLCIALSAHGSTRAKCIRSNGRIQIRSNTKDARTGRNTNTSILIATDMHATETLNQQWGKRVCVVFKCVWMHFARRRNVLPRDLLAVLG